MWVKAFAAVIAFMGIGAASARFGAKRTLVAGLALIVLATVLGSLASTIGQLVGLRAVWGLGNAFFIATALSVIVGAATGGQKGAILLYEAALGLGLSVGPLLGALLGSFSWRGPFIGTAALMAVALVLCTAFLADDEPRRRVRLLDPPRALRHPGLLRTAIGSALYTTAFFAVLAWSPSVLRRGAFEIGLVFFGWGACVALSGVRPAPRLADRWGERRATIASVLAFGALMLVMAVPSKPLPVAATLVSHLPQPFVIAAACRVVAAGLPAVGGGTGHRVTDEDVLVGEEVVG